MEIGLNIHLELLSKFLLVFLSLSEQSYSNEQEEERQMFILPVLSIERLALLTFGLFVELPGHTLRRVSILHGIA